MAKMPLPPHSIGGIISPSEFQVHCNILSSDWTCVCDILLLACCCISKRVVIIIMII